MELFTLHYLLSTHTEWVAGVAACVTISVFPHHESETIRLWSPFYDIWWSRGTSIRNFVGPKVKGQGHTSPKWIRLPVCVYSVTALCWHSLDGATACCWPRAHVHIYLHCYMDGVDMAVSDQATCSVHWTLCYVCHNNTNYWLWNKINMTF